jgi:hypothetical protein
MWWSSSNEPVSWIFNLIACLPNLSILSYCSSNLKRGRVCLSYERGDTVYPKHLNKFIEILSEIGNLEM